MYHTPPSQIGLLLYRYAEKHILGTGVFISIPLGPKSYDRDIRYCRRLDNTTIL